MRSIETLREYNHIHYTLHDKERKAQAYSYARAKFFEMYGHACACCGETLDEFLTLEHKEGYQHGANGARGIQQLRVAIREYKPDLYEVLCMNCNHAKGVYGYCPHQKRI